jgi:anti-sigma B factor antagonist
LRDSGRDAAWIRVAGELDLATAPARAGLREAEAGPRRVVLDLRALAFMDCAGVGVIVRSGQRVTRTGGRLVLVRGPKRVDRLFALTRTAHALELVALDPGSAARPRPRKARQREAV